MGSRSYNGAMVCSRKNIISLVKCFATETHNWTFVSRFLYKFNWTVFVLGTSDEQGFKDMAVQVRCANRNLPATKRDDCKD